mgnify:CR=1 FL=1
MCVCERASVRVYYECVFFILSVSLPDACAHTVCLWLLGMCLCECGQLAQALHDGVSIDEAGAKNDERRRARVVAGEPDFTI